MAEDVLAWYRRGKVGYPHCVGLPLTGLEEIPARLPAVAARLGEGGVWTKGVEEELLREHLWRM